VGVGDAVIERVHIIKRALCLDGVGALFLDFQGEGEPFLHVFAIMMFAGESDTDLAMDDLGEELVKDLRLGIEDVIGALRRGERFFEFGGEGFDCGWCHASSAFSP